MSLTELTSRDAVLLAMMEFDGLGRNAFLAKYGFAPSSRYQVVNSGRAYDSKAIAGAAFGFQFPKRGALRASEFSGGAASVVPVFEKLGFEIQDGGVATEDDLTISPNDLRLVRQGRSKAKYSDLTNEKADPAGQSELALRTVALPMFANSHGDIFGGWLLSQMDIAGAQVASRRAKGRVATIAITAMVFRGPVLVGDEVSCYTEITNVGRTSMTVNVKAFARREDETVEVTEGLFTYVAIGSDKKPRPVEPGG